MHGPELEYVKEAYETNWMSTVGENINEVERIAAEKAAAEAAKQAEKERVAAEKAAEEERIAAEKAAAEAARQAERDSIKKVREDNHNAKVEIRRERLDAIPQSMFFTVNAEMFNIPNQCGYGFKIGTMKNAGWYLSVMSNFNFKGAFTSFRNQDYYVLTGKSKTSYFDALIGITGRRYKPVSFHFGVGFGYRTLNLEAESGSWYNLPQRNFYGPMLGTGLMFHIKGVVLSVEGVGMYSLNKANPHKFLVGGKVGVGVCLPNKKSNKNKSSKSSKKHYKS